MRPQGQLHAGLSERPAARARVAGCQAGAGSGHTGARTLGETGVGSRSLSRKELGPSDIPPSVDLGCDKTTKPNQSHE